MQGTMTVANGDLRWSRVPRAALCPREDVWKMMSLLYLVIKNKVSILRLLLKFRLACIALGQRGR